MNHHIRLSQAKIKRLIKEGQKLPLATQHYPSRGQTSVQELYQTIQGKIFLKRSSKTNHRDCRVNMEAGSLAEREYWAYRLAKKIELPVPAMWLVDVWTTVQIWLNFPDGHQYATSQGKLNLEAENVFDCSLFDWITGQVDRHDANYLYNYVDECIILIDSAHSFLKYSGSIPDYLRYFEIGFPQKLNQKQHTKTQQRILALNESQLHRLVPLRDKSERQALTERLQQVQSVQSIQDIIDLYRGEK